MSGSYQISASLKGHEDDVRAVAFASSSAVVSASRDATVRAWHLKSSSPRSFDDAIILHGSAFINAVAYIPPSSAFPEPLIASGGKDAVIDVRHLGQDAASDPVRLLLGHQGNVCALDVGPGPSHQYLVSGSWDASAMVWDVEKGECTATLEGHSGAVWSVLAYDDETIITGELGKAGASSPATQSSYSYLAPACADHNIRLFSPAGKLVKTVNGGGDVVRALCKLPDGHASGAQFASAGNDAVVRLWTLPAGEELAQLHGHDSFIYALALLPSGELVSCGEDRSVRIWKDGKNTQTITHPAISVWTVAVNPENGDIASGASDRILRIFSRTSERQGDEATVKAFEDSVKQSSIPQQTAGDINKEQLPGPDFLAKRSGTKEGQVQMIREPNGNVSAHQWSHLAQQWVNVGTVVDAAGSSGRKNQHMGKEYDYVFDVDIEDGKPPLKLPYNLSQNPYEVAKKFIADNQLPLTYLDQVADFIVKNTQGATLGQSSSSASATASASSFSSSAPVSHTRRNVLPQTDYLTITTANFAIISRKIQELNAQLLSDQHQHLALSPDEQKQLPHFVATLESALSQSPSPSPSELTMLDAGSDVIAKMLAAWPVANRLPALDLLRCLAAAHPGLAQRHNVLALLSQGQMFDSGNANLTMLAIRALANMFATDGGREFIVANADDMQRTVSRHMQPTAGASNRNVHIAAATWCINFAVLLHRGQHAMPDTARFAHALLDDLAALLRNSKVVDSETIYRALVAIGTLSRVPALTGTDSEEVDDAVKSAAARCKEPRVKGLVDEMMP